MVNVYNLKYMPYAQAKIVKDENTSVLVSYQTKVAQVDKDGWLKIFGLYSHTTRKHIGAFMRELGLDYKTAKFLYENGLKLNINTGEIKDIDFNYDNAFILYLKDRALA